MEQAGADALELNIYYIPVDSDSHRRAGGAASTVDLVRAVKADVHIPVAVKLGPYFSSHGEHGQEAGCRGRRRPGALQPLLPAGFDLEALEVVPNLILSNSHELLLRLHWIAVLYGNVKADMALTGGVHCATDVVKAMMAGAKVAMMTSALLKTRHQLSGHHR